MSEQHEADPWLTYQQAAEIVGLHKNSISAAAKRGELQVSRLNQRVVRLRRSWLDAWITQWGASKLSV
jgi:excisionase family DNA binding protein